MDYPKPQQLCLDGNLRDNWKRFKTHFSIYATATKTDKEEQSIQVARFLSCAGSEAIELFHTFEFAENEDKKYDKVLEKFEQYCNPKTSNIIYERFLFYSRNQKEGEPFDHFLKDIAALVDNCSFGAEKDSMVRDRIVLGIGDGSVRTQLLKQSDLTLAKAIEICRVAEITGVQIKMMQGEGPTQCRQQEMVHAVNKTGGSSIVNQNLGKNIVNKNKNPNFNSRYVKGNALSFGNNGKVNSQSYADKKLCTYCNYVHPKGRCPAFGKTCAACGKFNHFASVCQQIKQVSDLAVKYDLDCGSDDDVLFVDSLNSVDISVSSWTEKLLVHNKIIEFKLDTGSQVNILPKNVWMRLKPKPVMNACEVRLEAYGGFNLHVLGRITLSVSYKCKPYLLSFAVADVLSQPLLGLKACVELGLLQRINSVEQVDVEQFILKNKEVFSGYGRFPDKCSIEVKDGAKAVSKSPRRLPLSIRSKVQSTLKQMENRGIISKVDVPSDWAHNMVVVEKKDNSLRICLDPKELNECIKDEHFIIPKFEDFRTEMRGMKYFTVLDLIEGFWQVELTEESKKLTVFTTPFGCYQFNVLPFGIKVAPEKFQKLNTKYFGDLSGTFIYIDDIIVGGKTISEHDSNLAKVIERAKCFNIKFNPRKVQYKTQEVKYLGHIFSALGVRPDPERVEAIKTIAIPKNTKDLQKILGTINYLRNFIPHLAELTQPLRDLLRKNACFEWTATHTKALDKIKDAIQNSSILHTFNPDIPIVIQSDASKYGLGCCLMQNGKPVSYASKSLTEAEIHYAQIEKELLAIVYACTKFSEFIYGNKILIQTDHKPLLSILGKSLSSNYSVRIQRMKIKLLKYDLTVEYIPGKDLHIADLLSRNPGQDMSIELEGMLKEVVHSVSMSDRAKDRYVSETNKDKILIELKKLYEQGWPNSKTKLPDYLKFYWSIKDALYVEDGLVFYEGRVFVPQILRKEALNKLHDNHFGITKTILRAKTLFYWPCMCRDIQNFISRCPICENYSCANNKHPMITRSIPEYPYQKVASDIFDFKCDSFLIVIDYYSRWIDIKKLQNKSASSVVSAFKEIFSSNGIPEEVTCDNQPFNSFKCREFAKDWEFKFTYSSPYYPKSNGLAEKGVHIIKNMFKKSEIGNKDFLHFLLEYRSTIIPSIGHTPSQLLSGRLLRTKHPVLKSLLVPKVSNNKVLAKMEDVKRRQKLYYDRNAHRKELDLEVGKYVMYRKGDKWERAIVEARSDTPRSYFLRNENNELVRRNTEQIRKSVNPPQPKSDDTEDNAIAVASHSSAVSSPTKDIDRATVGTDLEKSSNEIRDTSLQPQLKSALQNHYRTRYGREVRQTNFYQANV